MSTVADILAALQTLENVDIAFLVVATIPTFLRFYVRGVMTRNFGIDDWAMVACWICYVVCSGMAFVLREELESIFTTGVIPTNLVIFLKVNTGFYILTMTLLKASLGAFFLKIFTIQKSWQRYVIHSIIWFEIAYGIVNFALTVGTCGATSFFGSACSLSEVYVKVNGSWSYINAITDFILAGLTVQAIWNACLPFPTKVTASVVLLLGSLGGVASIVRIVLITGPLSGVSKGLSAGYWSLIEASIGIAAASLATLRPLFRSCMERVHSKGSSNKGSAYNTAANGSRVPTALRSRHQLNTAHDWREDRIQMDDIEKGVTNNTITASTTIMVEEHQLSDTELETRNLVVK